MNISLNWLKDYINFCPNIETIVDRLTFLGYEIEEVHKVDNTFANCVVGKVLKREKHPDADKLSVCQVKVSDDTELQIVCGAPNVAEGQTVPVATVGASFGDFKIKKAKLRGVESNGMICAEDELGLSDNHDGIMVLDDSIEAGTPLKDLFGYEDTVLEADITSNRPDMLGHIGFAREFTLFTGNEYKLPEIKLTESDTDANTLAEVVIEDTKGCPRYTSRVLKNVKVKESPKWLKDRLIAVGLRPINNIVDVTNYILMETGHPMHAFDLAKLNGNKIVVKRATNGQKFTTLDDAEHTLSDDILMICDAEKPVAVAGVMGGLDSGVTEETTDILLEVAYFNFVDIRNSSQKLKLSSDSSRRFERGVDPNDAEFVVNRAASLMQELSECEVCKGIIDVYPEPIKKAETEIRVSRTNKVIGIEFTQEQIVKYLESIEFECEVIDEDKIKVLVPTYRPDTTEEIHVIEEVIRVHGYDKLPELGRSNISLAHIPNIEDDYISVARRDLVALGLTETSSKTMVDGKLCLPFGEKSVQIEHPLNEEMNMLRNNILITLLIVASKNIRRRYERIAIFETGPVFIQKENSIDEFNQFGILVSGKRKLQSWTTAEQDFDFYDIKGYVEAFFLKRGYQNIELKQENQPEYFDKDESLSCYFDGKFVGCYGRIDDKVLKAFEIKQPVYAFITTNSDLLNLEEKKSFKIKNPSKYPKTIKDISLLLDDKTTAEIAMEAIKKYAGKYLIDLDVVDKYEGEQLKENEKSYSFRMTFQSDVATLKDKEIEKTLNKIINGLKKELKVQIR